MSESPVAPAPALGAARSSLRADVVRSPQVIFPAIAILMLVAWLPAAGGFSPAVFCAGGIGALILLVVSIATGAPLRTLRRSQAVAFASALGFVVWNFASIGWATDAGAAFDGANRTLLYVVMFLLFATTVWTAQLVYAIVAIFAFGTAAVAYAGFAVTAHASNPTTSFISARFTSVVGYENASAALLAVAALGATALAARRDAPMPARLVAFPAAAAAANVTVLTESRGAVLGTTIAVVVLLLLPDRGRSFIATLLVAAPVALATPALLNVYAASDDGLRPFSHALHHAFTMSTVSVVVAAVAGSSWLLLERLAPAIPGARRFADRAVLAAVVAVLVAPLAASAIRPHAARRTVASGWRSFAHNGSPTGSATRFTSLGSNRYDAYRVSLDEFAKHPIAGIGSDNFAIQYLEHRRSDEELQYPHSDALRIPLQTGIVGVLLSLSFLGAAIVGGTRALRSVPGAVTVVAVPIAYWLVHASVDWIWEVAGVTAPVAAFTGILVGLAPAPLRQPGPGARSRLAVAAVATVAAAAAVPLGSDWLSTRIADTAVDSWRSNPSHAVSQLDRASAIDPFSDRSPLLAAAIASRIDRPVVMARELDRAESRNSSNWYTRVLLAVVAAREGRWPAALREARTARRLNPHEETVAALERDVQRRRVPSLSRLNAVYLQRAQQRVRSGVVR
jgi:O-Antigen ligase